ncbi:MAG: hypothetical protein M1812_001261 [Candelaria pacifica]|nr:MAG: hypothetical protein M1812_001261 [Candelaria pacifica]
MSSLSYGLNITKKQPQLSSKPGPVRRKPIFGEDDDSEPEVTSTEDGVEAIGIFGTGASSITTGSNGQKTSSAKEQHKKINSKPPISQYGDLSSTHSSKKHVEDATALDPSIYDYDAAYDKLHTVSAAKKAAEKADAEQRKPKYMGNLLAAAEVRKRDALRAKEKMLAKEREAEGEEFADKETFVTEAYKTQQEEVKRMEEEERKREEEEAKRRKGRGMVGFYKSVLERDEKKHEEAVAAAATVDEVRPGPEPTVEDETREKSEAEIAKELNEKKAGAILMNDEGQVVDKRQLLSAGLNIAPKPKPTPVTAAASTNGSRPGASAGYQGRGGGQKAMRERQTRMMEAQLEQATKRAAEDEEEQRLDLERAAKSRKTEGEISSAKERYLQRKREAAAEKSKGV